MAGDGKKDPSLSSDAFAKKYGVPLILHFQPERFRVVKDAAKLVEWEARLKDRLGLRMIDDGGTSSESDCPSLPQSGDNLDTDECDLA